jgi:hypothetical protein
LSQLLEHLGCSEEGFLHAQGSDPSPPSFQIRYIWLKLELIQEGRGKKGLIAKAYVKKYLSKITFSWEEAIQTFETFILPKFLKYTLSTFPGVDKLCSDAQTALVSIVFNRGTSMKGATRKEMRELRKYVPHADYESIAAQIKSMKRLWDKDSGLVGRRDREAKLVENCLKH